MRSDQEWKDETVRLHGETAWEDVEHGASLLRAVGELATMPQPARAVLQARLQERLPELKLNPKTATARRMEFVAFLLEFLAKPADGGAKEE